MRDIPVQIWFSIVFLFDSAMSINPCERLKPDIEILENENTRLDSEYKNITKIWDKFEEEKNFWERNAIGLEVTYIKEQLSKSGLRESMDSLKNEIEVMKNSVKGQNSLIDDLKAKVKSEDQMIEMLEKVNSELRDEITFLRKKLDQKKNKITINNNPTWKRILLLAAKDGDVNEINFLVSEGVNITVRDDSPEHRTPLLIASASGHDKVVEILLNAGAHLDQSSSSLNTPLHEAASAGHLEVCQLLLDRNAKLEPRNKNNDTPLKLAKNKSHQNVVDLLIKKGAKV